MQYLNLQRPEEGYRPQQLRLLDARSKEDMEQVIAQRRLEIVSCLSAGYMRVRVAVIRTWVHFCVEVKGVSPWRLHWPKDESDDALMADYLVSLSLRYTDFSVIEASKMHVIEFHRGYLRVTPPDFHLAKWELSKIKRLLAVEFPLGRKVRPGLDFEQVCKICTELRRLASDSAVCMSQRRLFANCGAAIAATYSCRCGVSAPVQGAFVLHSLQFSLLFLSDCQTRPQHLTPAPSRPPGLPRPPQPPLQTPLHASSALDLRGRLAATALGRCCSALRFAEIRAPKPRLHAPVSSARQRLTGPPVAPRPYFMAQTPPPGP